MRYSKVELGFFQRILIGDSHLARVSPVPLGPLSTFLIPVLAFSNISQLLSKVCYTFIRTEECDRDCLTLMKI